jgi:O-antigen/teichoic acid export membrane protein
MFKVFARMRSSASVRNAFLSYAVFISTAAWGFISIPVAVRYLSKEELGLWAVVNAFLSYLMWMDMGVGSATGRKIADSIVAKDDTEINRWWSATRLVLTCQAFLLVVIGFALIPVLRTFIPPPASLEQDALKLLVGGILITGLFFPLRGIPGLLTSQNRFHWVLIISGTTPWINLLVFFLLLRAGYGLDAYIVALFVSQVCNFLLFTYAVRSGPNILKWDKGGLTKDRFKSLFSYSYKSAVHGIVDGFLKTLPTMIIARAGGLAIVPIYHFSSKGPLLGHSLASRMYQAFYPSLLLLHVGGKHEEFAHKYRLLGRITVGIGAIGAGFVLLINQTVVTLLAGPDYFPGALTNMWFAVSLITYPLAGLLLVLLPISGDLGKYVTVALAKAATMLVCGYYAWQYFQMPGLAAVMAIVPLIGGIYGYLRGGRLCGKTAHHLCAHTVGLATLLAGTVIACGMVIQSAGFLPQDYITLWESRIAIPYPLHFLVAALPTLLGTILVVHAGIKFYSAGRKV